MKTEAPFYATTSFCKWKTNPVPTFGVLTARSANHRVINVEKDFQNPELQPSTEHKPYCKAPYPLIF